MKYWYTNQKINTPLPKLATERTNNRSTPGGFDSSGEKSKKAGTDDAIIDQNKLSSTNSA